MLQKTPLAVLFLGLGPVFIVASFLWPSPAAIWIFAFVTMSFPVALIALGVASRESAGKRHLRWELLALFLSLQVSAVGLLVSAGTSRAVLFGLPPGAFFMLLGLWLVPLVLLSWTYPRVFSDAVLDRATLERVRAAARSKRD